MSTKRDPDRPGRKPAAFRLDDPRVVVGPVAGPPEGADAVVSLDPERAEGESAVPPPRRHLRFARLMWSGLAGLVALGFGIAIDRLIRDLFDRAEWLGWIGVGLAGLALIGVLGVAIREALAIRRLARAEHLRAAATMAVEADDGEAARDIAAALERLYSRRPDTARGRAELAASRDAIIDGRDRIRLAERALMRPLDRAARRTVVNAARQVSLVTAVSPRAAVDILFVAYAVMRLIRRIAAIYGGRPGALGSLRLIRAVVAHLAVTGGMAAGDSLISQVLGHGLAAKLSARLGEGVVNGLMTARLGVAAIAVCRPLPFVGEAPIGVSDLMAEIVRRAEEEGV